MEIVDGNCIRTDDEWQPVIVWMLASVDPGVPGMITAKLILSECSQ